MATFSSLPHVLCLPGWYPYPSDLTHGIFIKKHIEAISKHYCVTVLYIAASPCPQKETYVIHNHLNQPLAELTVFYKTDDIPDGKLFHLVKLWRYVRSAYKGWQMIKKTARYDMAHVHVAYPAGRMALLLYYLKGIPYVLSEQWTGYTRYDNNYNNLSSLNKYIIRLTYKKAKAVSTISAFLQQALAENKIHSPLPYIIPNIVEVNELPDFSQRKATPVKILTISDMRDDQKNISGLIKGIHTIVKTKKEIELHHIGIGSDEKQILSLAQKFGMLNKHIFFHGYVPNYELKHYFETSHFFVLNSNYETFSVATAEAIGHGLPVVVTRCGAPEEYMSDEIGILIERNKEDDLVKGLLFMINNWQNYRPIHLQKIIYQQFNKDSIGEKFNKMYRQLME